jgi:murein DD-endopeptidase MepM/ murein hydrolase activator NlpD
VPRVPAALLLLAAVASAQWGRDINEGMGEQLIRSVREDLAAIVKAPEDRRGRLIKAAIEAHGRERIEALKRFRNPELKPLFLRLLDHDDWQVQHRALFVLEYYGAKEALPKAWELLAHPHRRLREKAAITLIKLWDGSGPSDVLDARLRDEKDFHVRRCLEALAVRKRGKLAVDKVAKEYVRTDPDGLMLTPFLSGMNNLGKVAPGLKLKGDGRTGKGSANRLPPAPRWTTPVLGYGQEEVDGVSLQPFGNLRANGTVYHTGQDVGACLEGAGFYAIAAGYVKFVYTGSDMGTLICTEHHVEGDRLVTAVYMHGGDTVFVEPGDQVVCGQLLGTMGMGYSVENGGHYAHLHFGLYPGPFRVDHNFGYRAVKAGLADWYDPAKFLPKWIERTAPLVPDLRPLDKALGRAVRSIGDGKFGQAYEAVVRVRDGATPGDVVHADAVYLVGLLEQVPGKAQERATKLRDGGYAGTALERIEGAARACRGIPGADALAATAGKWEADPLFAKALKGERKLESTAKRAARAKTPEKARAMWRKLLDEYGDTCLRPRIEEALGRVS